MLGERPPVGCHGDPRPTGAGPSPALSDGGHAVQVRDTIPGEAAHVSPRGRPPSRSAQDVGPVERRVGGQCKDSSHTVLHLSPTVKSIHWRPAARARHRSCLKFVRRARDPPQRRAPRTPASSLLTKHGAMSQKEEPKQPVVLKAPSALRSVIAGSTAGAIEIGEFRTSVELGAASWPLLWTGLANTLQRLPIPPSVRLRERNPHPGWNPI